MIFQSLELTIGFFSNSTGSSVTGCQFSPFTAPERQLSLLGCYFVSESLSILSTELKICSCTKKRNMLWKQGVERNPSVQNVTELEKEFKAEDTHSMCYKIASSDDCLGTNRVVNMGLQKARGRPDEGQTPVLPAVYPKTEMPDSASKA